MVRKVSSYLPTDSHMNILRPALWLLVLAGTLTACRTDTEVTDATAETVAFRRTDNAPVIVLTNEPPGLNPILTSDATSRNVWNLLFETLNDLDYNTFEDVPMLASLPKVQNEAGGGVSYSYDLDPDAKWPNGLPVTSADVVFSLKALLNPLVESGPYRPYYSMISRVIISPANERRFKVMTDEPYLLSEAAIGSLVIYPEYAFDPDGLLRDIPLDQLTDPATAERLAERNPNLAAFAERFNDPDSRRSAARLVGSGPYQLAEWTDGQRIRLTARENYWAADRSDLRYAQQPDTLDFQWIADNNTVVNGLRDELVDVVIDMDVEQFRELREDDYLSARYAFESVPSLRYFSILLNQNDPLLADPKTRRALAHAVNIDVMVDEIFGGLASRISGPILEGKSYFNEELLPLDFDPERARELLAEAGWSDTNGDGTVDREIDGQRRELSFELLTFPSPVSEGVMLIAAEGMNAIGADVEVVPQEPRALYGELNKGNFVASIFGQGRDPGPDELTQVWASTSVPPNGSNRSGFADAEADRLIRQIKVTTDADERDPLYRRFQEIVYENQPMIFLFSPDDRVLVSKRFDFEPTSISPNVAFNALELAE